MMNQKRTLLNLVFCSVMHGLNHYLLIFFKPMYPQIGEYFGLSNIADLTTRMTLLYAAYGLSNFLAGLLCRYVGLKFLIAAGMALMSASTIMFALVGPDMYGAAVVLVFLMGLGGGTYHPAANTLITSCYEQRRGHAIGILSIGSAVGFVAAPFAGQHIGAGWLGFRGLFAVSGLAALAFDLVFLAAVKEPPRADRKASRQGLNDRHTLSGKPLAAAIVLICIPVTLRELVGWSFYEITPFWVHYGFSAGITIGLVQAMQYMPGLLVQPVTGKLCDRFNPLIMVIATFGMMGLGAAMFAFNSPAVLWTALVLFGCGAVASTVASETFMASVATAAHRPLVYGICLSIGLAAGGFSAGISGAVVDFFGRDNATGYQLWFAGSGTALMLSAFLYLAVRRPANEKRGRLPFFAAKKGNRPS